MVVHLLDVNVLVALAWPQHVHHDRVGRWFLTHAASGWATCPITQLGFVRVSSNAKIMGAAASPDQAIAALRQLIQRPDHVFWPDDVMATDSQWVPHEIISGYRQVTDAYLVGLCAKRGGRLVTLDQAMIAVVPASKASLVLGIP